MPLTETDFVSIRTLVESMIADLGNNFMTDEVMKKDDLRKIIWTKGLGDQPVPVVDFMLDTKYYIPSLLPDTWHDVGGSGEPAFQNNWQNYDTSIWEASSFRFNAVGNVELKGLVKKVSISAPAANEIIFNIPAAYRPAKKRAFATAAGDNSNNVHGRVDVTTGGDVLWVTGSATTASSFQSFDTVRFEPAKLPSVIALARSSNAGDLRVPSPGDTVLIAFERGTRRLPRCIGVFQSQEFIKSGDD